MDFNLILPGFIAGLLTFFAPCTLPLIPVYLGIIGGSAMEELKTPGKETEARKKIFLNGIFFVLGFTLIFVALGVLFGLIGSAFSQHRALLSRIGGVFVIFFGLFMVGILKIPILEQTRRIALPRIFKIGHPLNSAIIGLSFGLGWTPCIGPVLGSIHFLASTTSTAIQGGILLLIFSFGLSVPFLGLALAVSHATRLVKKLTGVMKWISLVGGAFLIFLGVLLLTDSLSIWVTWFFKIFGFINFDNILKYL